MSSFPAYFGGFYGGWYGPQLVATLSPDERKAAQADRPVSPNDPLDRSQFAYFAYGSRNGMPGFDAAPPWSIPIAWQMRRYSTLALAFKVTVGPILAGTRTIEIGGEANAEAETWKKNAEQDFLPLVHKALTPSMECLNFGHWLQEVVWDRKNGRTVPIAYKSIPPGVAQLYQDEYGNFVGYKLGQEFRDARYAFLSVNDSHIDPINGYARPENCREEWWRARQSNANGDRTERKASGIQMGLSVPQGASWVDATGKQIFPQDIARTLTDAAARGDTFVVPRFVFDKKAVEANPALADIEMVKVLQYDWGNTGPAILAQIARLNTLQRDMMRGYCRPEREAMEAGKGGIGQSDSKDQGAIGKTDSELVHTDRCEQLSEQSLRFYVDTNCPTPPEKRGWYLYIKPAPLSDPQQQFLQEVAMQLFTTPQTAQEMATYPDKRQLLERVEIPLRTKEEVDADLAEQEAQQKANADQMQKQLQGQPNTDGGAADGYPPNGKKNGFGGRLAASADAPIDRFFSLMREIGTEPEDE